MKKRLISLLLASAMTLSLLPVSAFADYTVGGISPDTVTAQELDAENTAEITRTFEVANGTQFGAVLNRINGADDDGNYVIKLTDDINLNDDTEGNGSHYFEKGTTTILGEGHSISGGNGLTLGVTGSAVLNLGAADYKGDLILKGVSDYSPTGPLLHISGNASVNMYDGVTLQDHKVVGSDAGVQLNGHANFTMYGGTIKNCENAASSPTAGGVGAHDYSTFTMKDGSIENCSSYYGGGVIVAYGTFVMEGGSIENCSATLGGGICAIQGTIDLSNGTITGNKATYGGGLLLSQSKTAQAIQNCTITGNSATIGGGIVLMDASSMDLSGAGNIVCNNTATSGAADIFLNKADDGDENSSITLPDAAAMKQPYGNSDKMIDGWYVDDPQYTPSEDAVAVDISKPLTGELALVASYKIPTLYNITLVNEAGETLETLTAEANETVYLNTPASIPMDQMVSSWKVLEPEDLELQKENGRWYFIMPASNVTVQAHLESTVVNPDEPSSDDGMSEGEIAAIVGGAAIGTAAVGTAAYYAGTTLYLKSVLPKGAVIPTDRQALATLLWTNADKPEPLSTALYTDVDADDADAQKADRWCVEQGLLKDRGSDTFYPGLYVTRVQVIQAWNAAQNLQKTR